LANGWWFKVCLADFFEESLSFFDAYGKICLKGAKTLRVGVVFFLFISLFAPLR
jgi:hypothetical protein